MAELRGVGVSPGLAGGPVRHLSRPEVTRPADEPAHRDVEDELRAARDALAAVAADLDALGERAGGEARDVLSAEALMARDPEIADAVAAAVRGGRAATVAVYDAFGTYRDLLAGAGEYMAGRVADVEDVRDRVVARLRGVAVAEVPDAPEPYVLVARELTPADTAGLNPAHVRGFVTEEGGPTSHTAILARSLGLPAVVGCPGATGIEDGKVILVDGDSGEVFLDPVVGVGSASVFFGDSEPAANHDGRTADGRPVPLLANLGGPFGLAAEIDAALAAGAEGVGLLRTEFLFLDRTSPPTEDEQVSAYRQVLSAFGVAPVVVRVLDSGADKPLGFLPPPAAEPNPALGLRGIRALRRHPELLDVQLRALASAAAAVDAQLRVMAPMVADAGEAAWFAERWRSAGEQAGIGCAAGAMIEVPAAAVRAAGIAAEVDFFSIGTNDLCQYAFAADRGLAGLAALQDPWQPALLDMVAMAVAGAASSGIRAGVCGEAASDPALACALVGLGVETLSMGAASIPRVRAALAANTSDACAAAAEAARSASSAAEARAAALEHLHLG